MDLTTLSLTALPAALPAATGLVQQAAKAGGQLGNSFLEVLQAWAAPAAENEAADNKATAENAPLLTAASADLPTSATAELSQKTRSWCERLVSWLRREHGVQAFGAQVSLDELDQPKLDVEGAQSASVRQALEQDPTWLQEFRELALDRTSSWGHSSITTPASPSLSLQVSSEEDQPLVARWQ